MIFFSFSSNSLFLSLNSLTTTINFLLNKLNKRNSYECDDLNKKYLYEEENKFLLGEKNDNYLLNHMNTNYGSNIKKIGSNENIGNKNVFPSLKYQYTSANYENSFLS